MDVLPNTRAFWVRTSPSKVGEKATGRDPATARDGTWHCHVIFDLAVNTVL